MIKWNQTPRSAIISHTDSKRGEKRKKKGEVQIKSYRKHCCIPKDTCKSQNTDCYSKKQWDEHISMQAVLHVYWIVTLVLSSLALCISCWSEVHYFLSVSNKSLVIACYRCQDLNPQTLQLRTPRAAVIIHSQACDSGHTWALNSLLLNHSSTLKSSVLKPLREILRNNGLGEKKKA